MGLAANGGSALHFALEKPKTGRMPMSDYITPPGYDRSEYPESLAGYFLISEAEMMDPNFFRTVVLIIRHDETGAFGLVVNRKSNLNLGDVLPEYDDARGTALPLYVGGPVQQEFLFVVHSPYDDHAPSAASIEPVEGVVFEPAFDNVRELVELESWQRMPKAERPHVLLFLGYSGWAPGQLENELEEGAWILHPARPHIVFHPNPEEGWKDALRDKGGLYRIFADTDQKPSTN
jgi:putative transcriptional regulator